MGSRRWKRPPRSSGAVALLVVLPVSDQLGQLGVEVLELDVLHDLGEQRVDERVGVELGQVLDALAEADELHEQCDSGRGEACEALTREEEAKRAWLAKQTHADKLQAQCETGADAACEELTREEEAKRAWLARHGVLNWRNGARETGSAQ